MIRLALVRHAKSDWGDPSLDDHDRPLNDRGMRDAPRMARRLAETGFRPDVILSSTALRARTTAEAFGAELRVAVSLDPELYGAPARTLLAVAAATGARTPSWWSRTTRDERARGAALGRPASSTCRRARSRRSRGTRTTGTCRLRRARSDALTEWSLDTLAS